MHSAEANKATRSSCSVRPTLLGTNVEFGVDVYQFCKTNKYLSGIVHVFLS